MRESINRAFAYLMGQKVKMGIGQQVDTTDFHVEAIDLLEQPRPMRGGDRLGRRHLLGHEEHCRSKRDS